MFNHHHTGSGQRNRLADWVRSGDEHLQNVEDYINQKMSDRARDRARGRGPRMFGGSELRLVLLKLIEEQPRHGYDLIRDIEERTGGAYAPSPGVVYPTLTLLADMALIDEAPSEGSRKLFAVTDAGRAMLAKKADEVAGLFARLSELGAMRARTDKAPIRRAMTNLQAVLHNRLSGEDVATATLHDIAALIDEAAGKIERM